MWTAVHLSVQLTLDLARWHASALWLDDPALDPVMLTKSGHVRVHPYDSPDAVLARVLDDLTEAAAGEDWRVR